MKTITAKNQIDHTEEKVELTLKQQLKLAIEGRLNLKGSIYLWRCSNCKSYVIGYASGDKEILRCECNYPILNRGGVST